MPLQVGARLGPFEVLSALGAGGMGEVYKARDTRLDRTVALKILPEHLAADPIFRERFEREARVISRLDHPNICTLHDIGETNGISYLVMQYLAGETLAARIEHGALPFAEVLALAISICDALDKAHRAGIVHRDLKPGNVMLTKAGAVLLDFGLAKMRTAAAAPGLTAMPTKGAPLTTDGTIFGTLHYMSPEQLEGREADHRSDIWALGCMLHEMVTGRRPFDGASQAGVIAAILRSEPSLEPLAGVDERLRHVVSGCLAKDPEDRWQDARDVGRELKAIADKRGEGASRAQLPAVSSAGTPRPSTAARLRGAPVLMFGLTVLALAVGVVGGLMIARGRSAPPPAQPPIRFTISPPPRTQFYDFADPVRVSPDGHQLAFVTQTAQGLSQLWLQPLESLTAQPLAGTEGANYPFWSPDGQSIAFFADSKLKIITLAGGAVRATGATPIRFGGAWNEKGVIVFGAGPAGGGLQRLDVQAGSIKPLTDLDQSRHEVAHVWPVFLPDGDRFLYLARAPSAEESSIVLGSLSSPKTSVRLFNAETNVALSAGYLLFARRGSLWAQPFDPARATLSGEVVSLADRVWRFFGHAGSDFSVSDNGTLAFRTTSDTTTALTWFDRSGKRLGTEGEPGEYVHVAIAPDGGRLAFERLDTSSGIGIVWVRDFSRSTSSRISFGTAWAWTPVWSSDGSALVFASSDAQGTGIFQKPAREDGSERLLVSGGDQELILAADSSPDGRLLLYTIQRAGGTTDVWVKPLSGAGQPFAVLDSPFNETNPRFSPNGRWLAYMSDESGKPQVYVRSFPDGKSKVVVSPSTGTNPLWRADGRELFYLGDNGMLMAVTVTADATFKAETPVSLFPIRSRPSLGGGRYDYAVTPDGRRLLVNELIGEPAPATVTVVINWPSLVRK